MFPDIRGGNEGVERQRLNMNMNRRVRTAQHRKEKGAWEALGCHRCSATVAHFRTCPRPSFPAPGAEGSPSSDMSVYLPCHRRRAGTVESTRQRAHRRGGKVNGHCCSRHVLVRSCAVLTALDFSAVAPYCILTGIGRHLRWTSSPCSTTRRLFE